MAIEWGTTHDLRPVEPSLQVMLKVPGMGTSNFGKPYGLIDLMARNLRTASPWLGLALNLPNPVKTFDVWFIFYFLA